MRTQYSEDFEKARKLYPGVKRGCETEFACLKKHNNWKEIIPLLYPAIESQILRRRKNRGKGEFVPPWKHFKTWLNNCCWEEEENSIADPERIAEKEKSAAEKKVKEKAADKAYQEKCARELEERRQEIRELDGPKFRELTTEKLRALLRDKTKSLWITRYWLIEEILKERLLKTKE